MATWKNYHKRHPKAVAFVLRGDSYMTSPIPEAEAKRLNVYQIFGWNDSVIDYMKFVLGQLRGVTRDTNGEKQTLDDKAMRLCQCLIV